MHYLKENCILQVFLFHSKVLPPYRKIELLKLLTVLFWIMQNFTSISRPFRPTVHQNDRNKIDLNLSKLSKTVRDLKIGQSLAIGPRYYCVAKQNWNKKENLTEIFLHLLLGVIYTFSVYDIPYLLSLEEDLGQDGFSNSAKILYRHKKSLCMEITK